MRYAVVSPCFLLVLLLALSSCTLDDGNSPNKDTATAVAGQRLVVDIGVARLEIPAGAIGGNAGQLQPGSTVALRVTRNAPANIKLYSPVIEITVTAPDGNPASGLSLTPNAEFELSYNYSQAVADGRGPDELVMLKISGTTTTELVHTTTTPATDTNWVVLYDGRARARLTSLSRFAMAERKDLPPPPPPPVALTGNVSAVATSTIFQLANAGGTTQVNLAIPTADTTGLPRAITLNDAAFNAANPFDPNNRLLTVATGGVTYTTDHANASVTANLNTFAGGASTGTITGTVVQQGGSNTLAINFTWTTGGAAGTGLGGAMIDAGGRRTMTLSDAAQGLAVVVLMPDTLPDSQLAPITFNDASFDVANPTDPAGRIVTVTEAGETFSSDVAIVGNVTVTFQTFDAVTRTGAGTITGTAVSATPNLKSLNLTFTVTGAGLPTPAGSLTAGTPVNTNPADVAVETAVVFDGIDVVAVWLSNIGVTNRTLEFIDIDEATLAPGTQEGFEPTVSLDPTAGFSAAMSETSYILIAGATGPDAATAQAHVVVYDWLFSTGVEVALGIGAQPRAAYNPDSGNFVVAWQQGNNVMVRCFADDGTPVSAAVTAFTGAQLRGLAAAGGTHDEAIVTAGSGAGVKARLLTPSTGAMAGAEFDVSTALDGGICAWDGLGAHYVVITEQLIQGFFTAQVARAVAPGASAPTTEIQVLPAAAAISGAAGGDQGVLLVDASSNFVALRTVAGAPVLTGLPVIGAAAAVNTDLTLDGPALGSASGSRYIALAARGADGAQSIPLDIVP